MFDLVPPVASANYAVPGNCGRLARAEFAVESIRRWWRMDGKRHYREVQRLLTCADSGGGNGSRRTPVTLFCTDYYLTEPKSNGISLRTDYRGKFVDEVYRKLSRPRCQLL